LIRRAFGGGGGGGEGGLFGGGGGGGLFGGGGGGGQRDERAHRQAERIGEAEAGQIANVEQYESRLDEYARSLGRAEIRDEQQFKTALQSAILLAEEAEKVEMEMENIMQQVEAGQYGDKTRKQVKDLRGKYGDVVDKLFKRVQAAEQWAKMERQQLLTELKALLAASQADQRIRTIESKLNFILKTDKTDPHNNFSSNHGLNAQSASDIKKLREIAKELGQLENDKAAILIPAEQQLTGLANATNIEIKDLDKIMTDMTSLRRLGQLRRPQLNAVVQQLNALLQMSGAKQHGIQKAQDMLKRVRNVDNRIREAAIMYKRLEEVLMNLTVKKAGLGARLVQENQNLKKALRI
ncbi:MAG: hypothetical protein AABX60_01090, partial [Nanoarchaeota archaeon]